MKKTCLIQQEAGFGDIFFCQGISEYFSKEYDIIWPVATQILETVKYLKPNLKINFVDNNSEFEYKQIFKALYESKNISKLINTNNSEEILFLPLGYSSHIIQPYMRQVMQANIEYVV